MTVVPESLEVDADDPAEAVDGNDISEKVGHDDATEEVADTEGNEINEENPTRVETPVANDTAIREDGGEEEETTKAEKMFRFPLGTIKRLVKLDDDVNMVNQEAIFCVSKATEYFIESLAKESFGYTTKNKKKTILKNDVSTAIETVEALAFLDGAMEE